MQAKDADLQRAKMDLDTVQARADAGAAMGGAGYYDQDMYTGLRAMHQHPYGAHMYASVGGHPLIPGSHTHHPSANPQEQFQEHYLDHYTAPTEQEQQVRLHQ
jgi:hypothetical protein